MTSKGGPYFHWMRKFLLLYEDKTKFQKGNSTRASRPHVSHRVTSGQPHDDHISVPQSYLTSKIVLKAKEKKIWK